MTATATAQTALEKIVDFVSTTRSDRRVLSLLVAFSEAFETANTTLELTDRLTELLIRKKFVSSLVYLSNCSSPSRICTTVIRLSETDDEALVWLQALKADRFPDELFTAVCFKGFLVTAQHLLASGNLAWRSSETKDLLWYVIRRGHLPVARWLVRGEECRLLWPEGNLQKVVWPFILDLILVHEPRMELLQFLIDLDIPPPHNSSWTRLILDGIDLLPSRMNYKALAFTPDHQRIILALLEYAHKNCPRFDDLLSTRKFKWGIVFSLSRMVDGAETAAAAKDLSHSVALLIETVFASYPLYFSPSVQEELAEFWRTSLNSTHGKLPRRVTVFVLLGWLSHSKHPFSLTQLIRLQNSDHRLDSHTLRHVYFGGKKQPSIEVVLSRLFEIPLPYPCDAAFWFEAFDTEEPLLIEAAVDMLQPAKGTAHYTSLGSELILELRNHWVMLQRHGILKRVVSQFLVMALDMIKEDRYNRKSLATRWFPFCHPDLAHTLFLRHCRTLPYHTLYDACMTSASRAILVWYSPDSVSMDRWMAVHYRSFAEHAHTIHSIQCRTAELARVVAVKLVIKERGGHRIVLGPISPGSPTTSLFLLPAQATNLILSYCWFRAM